MSETFGKYVTVVKLNRIGTINMIKHRVVYFDWCYKYVGEMGADWDCFFETCTFVFTRPEDASAFKLKFGA